jgi:hypothetical protein
MDKEQYGTVLIFDSYYTDKTSRDYLNTHNVPFIGSCRSDRFGLLNDHLAAQCPNGVNKPGDTAAIRNTSTGELFINHWDVDTRIKKKIVLTNALQQNRMSRRADTSRSVVPGYMHYRNGFNLCDRFNRGFHHKKYCHRHGGNDKRGEEETIDVFMKSSIVLSRTLLMRMCVNNISTSSSSEDKKSFEECCILLSNELVTYAVNKFLVI